MYFLFFQERIRVGKELLEAKRIEEENERKRYGFVQKFSVSFSCCIGKVYHYFLQYLNSLANWHGNLLNFDRILALRKAEKEEERRAREKIRQKLEEDKV